MIERSELIEDYLDKLLAALRGAPRDVRRMVAETEQHLYQAADAGVAGGLSAEQSAREAVDRFGPAARVAAVWNADAPEQPGVTGGNPRRVALGRLRRRRAVIVACGLFGVVAGLTVAWLAAPEPQYMSITTLVVYPPPDQTSVSGARVNSSVNMDNELQFITSVDVVSVAKKLLKVDTETNVLDKQLTATVPANTSVIDIAFSAGTPDKALKGSHAFAEAYLDTRTAQARGSVALQVESLTKQLTSLQADVAKYAGQAAGSLASSTEHQFALTQLDILKTSIANVNARLSPLATVDPTAGAIIQDARTPTAPSNPQPSLLVYLLAGLSTGMLIAALLAAVTPTRPTETPPALLTA